MSIGEMWDASAEQSEKRVQKHGYDPVMKKSVDKYEKRTGKPHPTRVNQNVKIEV
jgi:hypothetical protein